METLFKQLKNWMMPIVLAGLVSGCTSIGHVAQAPTTLDLGSALSVETTAGGTEPIATLIVAPLSSSPVLKGTGVLWRQGLEGQPHSYATYVWAASPNAMVYERLIDGLSKSFAVLDNGTSDRALTVRVNLLQFEQVYAPDGSKNEGIVSVQAVLLRGTQMLGQWRDTQRVSASANDAPAGAQALRVATDQVASGLSQWITQIVRKAR
ncbi:ABC-type transport auxiliary lipoprotein family protein [Orrella sp. 11846]|uniref:ABC-type transport auxiliary lipoprotein family protein n=1 Tax=Orrella sp. 11846 TaxID=3409913 RepID=UPI003B59DE65